MWFAAVELSRRMPTFHHPSLFVQAEVLLGNIRTWKGRLERGEGPVEPGGGSLGAWRGSRGAFLASNTYWEHVIKGFRAKSLARGSWRP